LLYGQTMQPSWSQDAVYMTNVVLPELVSNADAAMTSSLLCAATTSINDVTNNEAANIVIPEISMTGDVTMT